MSVSIFSQQVTTPTIADEITLHVTLTDEKAKYITGFNKNVFSVTGGKEPLEITSFAQDEPAEVLNLLDKSDFMSDYYRSTAAKQSFILQMLSLFLGSANAANGSAVYAFNKTQQP